MDAHLTSSPSHSASASASSSIRKRKHVGDDHLPPFPSDTRSLDSISAPRADSDSDTDTDIDDEMETCDDRSSVRSSVMIAPSAWGGKDGPVPGNAATTISSPITIGASASVLGAHCAREESLKMEENSGKLRFVYCSNDGVDQHMIWLVGLKNVVAKQLTNMPKEYIVRFVMDRNHKSVVVLRDNIVVGGITYRPFYEQSFAEIVFCAVIGDEQIRGYGSRMMSHLKVHARDVDGLTHLLTYADNNAVGYFAKQGFNRDISMPREQWVGYIKDYDSALLMECQLDPKLPYTDFSTMIRRQRQALDEKIRQLSNSHIVYPAIDFQKNEVGVPQRSIKVEEIPGLKLAGLSIDQYGYTEYKMIGSSADDAASNKKLMTAFMRSLVKIMQDHPDGWPFKEPVDVRDAPDYYEIVKDPMDLETMSKRVESEAYYVTLDMFIADVKRMFQNARTYNAPETIYYKCSTRLESHIMNVFQSGVQSGVKK